jgi:C-terminal binding-module, SLH-like, of glucodextranase
MFKQLTLCAVFLAGCASVPVTDAQLWTLTDPRGDDSGSGPLVYPLSPDFEKGDLDLVRLTATRVAGGTQFEAEMARPIRMPQRRTVDSIGTQLDQIAKLGFYTFNIDVYIDTDRAAGSGSTTTLPGRGVLVDPSTAWEKVIALTPDPDAARSELKRIVVRDERRREQSEGRKGIIEETQRAELQGSVDEFVFFPTQVRVAGNRISFFVPDSFLGGEAKSDWSYLVAVSGADVINRLDQQNRFLTRNDQSESLLILPVTTGRPTDRFGGALQNDSYMPPLVDIIVGAGEDQKTVLSSYDPDADKPAVLKGVTPR